MKNLFLVLLTAVSVSAANVKISDLPLVTSPSTNTFIEVADMDAATKSGKYLLTNLVTWATNSSQGIAPTGPTNLVVTSSGSLRFYDTTTANPLLNGVSVTATGGFQPFFFSSQYNGAGTIGLLSADVYADYAAWSHTLTDPGIKGFAYTVTPTSSALTFGLTAGKDFQAEPTAADGTAPYRLGSESTHTTGNLVETSNNGTNKFMVGFQGAVTFARSTEPSAPAAGYGTLFLVDNGSGKMILKVRFPTGTSQTVATEP